MDIRWLNSRIRRRARVWAVPALYILGAIILGGLLPELNSLFFTDTSFFSLEIAIGLLSAIASGMIAFTGFVFSMSFLLVQFGSSAYSPRLTRYFLEHTIVRHALGMFIATFLYALIALSVLDLGDPTTISDLTILGALAGVFGSIILFLALIHHITTLQVTNVLHMVGDRGRRVIHKLYPLLENNPTGAPKGISQGQSRPGPGLPLRSLPEVTQRIDYHGSPLAIIAIDIPRLVSLASSANAIIEINYSIGDMVADGAPLIEVRGGERKISEWRLSQTIEMGNERTIEQDPKYAIRLIVDIAIRGLSLALNDPTTAVQALNQLEDLLRRIGCRQLDVGYCYDREGNLRVIYPTPSWEDFLDLALDEIRFYGATSLQVMRRLRALLQDLYEAVPQDRRGLISHHLDRVSDSVQRAFPDIEDRYDAGQADRQGMGLSRVPDEE